MCFFRDYFSYVGLSEAPATYHRWTAISIIGALLGRRLYIPFGHGRIYPNQYVMLMGAPGARKGTAMNIGRKLLRDAGYSTFAPDRVSKEAFLIEMIPKLEIDGEEDLEILVLEKPAETYVVAEEFGDFMGPGNMEFATMLTKLWDNMDQYTHPKIHGRSVVVDKPTVNLFAGNTTQGLALTIPPEALGNGFMSRILFIHADETGRKITFPKPPSQELKQALVERLKDMMLLEGEMQFAEDCEALCERIYTEFAGVDDSRFKHYATRRFTHLLKLSLIHAAARLSKTIEKEDILNSNTVLHYAERHMPKALGEFGKNKHSDIINTIMELLHRTVKPITLNELWKHVAKDLQKLTDLTEIMRNLMHAEKVQVITDPISKKQGYMPLHREVKEWAPELLNPDFLTMEELS